MSGRKLTVDPAKLTAVLAARLAAIVPDGFQVRAADGMLWYTCEPGRFPGQTNNYHPSASGTYVQDNFEAHAEELSAAHSAASVARQALDELQDYIDEATHDPWPATARPPWAFAEVRGAMLHLWYGGPDAGDEPVLSCEPIPLASLHS